MKKILLLIVIFFVSMSTVHADDMEDAVKEYLKSTDVFAASNASLAAYDDKVGILAYEFSKVNGWHTEKHVANGAQADAYFFLASKQDESTGEMHYILSFRGTVSDKDRKIDLKTKKILFSGEDVFEIRENSQKKDASDNLPKVHEGFLEYVLVVLEDSSKDESIEESLHTKLKNNPSSKILITGHSLGGAAAIIYAASLLNMGVSPEQIKVITFGAPAVGNEAFVQEYESKIDMIRVYSPYDPIPGALQSIRSGYKQFGSPLVFAADIRYKGMFQHGMEIYADLSGKYYYDSSKRAVDLGAIVDIDNADNTADNKVAIIVVTPEDTYKLNEYYYAKENLLNLYKTLISNYYIIDLQKHNLTKVEAEELGKKVGADTVLVAKVDIKRDKFKGWVVEVSQVASDVSNGKILSTSVFSSKIKEGSSFFQAVLYNSLLAAEELKNKAFNWLN